MYDDFDDDQFLSPEALLSLHFESNDWGLARADAMERAGRLRFTSEFDAIEDDLMFEDDLEEEPDTASAEPLTLS